MEAKDTVIPVGEHSESISCHWCGGELGIEYRIENARVEQAEVSFKAGIREVVRFTQPLLDRIDSLVSDIRGDWTDPRTECRAIWDITSEWQAKLKEWGI